MEPPDPLFVIPRSTIDFLFKANSALLPLRLQQSAEKGRKGEHEILAKLNLGESDGFSAAQPRQLSRR
jgi:hypothetical protein